MHGPRRRDACCACSRRTGCSGPPTSRLAGLLASAAYQFRPNLILLPPFIAAGYLLFRARLPGSLRRMVVFLTIFAVGAVPWIVRNYRFTGLFIPASTHGGVQLWFGTLQTGPLSREAGSTIRARRSNSRLSITRASTNFRSSITGETFDCYGQRPRAGRPRYAGQSRPGAAARCTRPSARTAMSRRWVPAQPSPTAVDYCFETPPHSTGDNGRSSSEPRPPLATSTVELIMRWTCSTSSACSGTWPGGVRSIRASADFDHDGRVTEARSPPRGGVDRRRQSAPRA